MRPAALLFLLLLPLAPSALAEESCGVVAGTTGCVQEVSSSPDSDCSEDGETREERTRLDVDSPVGWTEAWGQSWCLREGPYRAEGDEVYAAARTGNAYVSVRWAHAHRQNDGGPSFGGCGVEVTVREHVAQTACPAGVRPPNPAWGQLLP